ncbi:hypothetical protein ACFXKG_10965 [Streptomyces sp. NPDC059255]|uniref:hypothetical protein n=1 Tax=Streptomyces sp. NPDC059255 TaxID=3346793 RepID=UPI0036ADC38B
MSNWSVIHRRISWSCRADELEAREIKAYAGDWRDAMDTYESGGSGPARVRLRRG